jgi:hypothetical protein
LGDTSSKALPSIRSTVGNLLVPGQGQIPLLES